MRLVYEILPNNLFHGVVDWEYSLEHSFNITAVNNIFFINLFIADDNILASTIDFFNCYKTQLNVGVGDLLINSDHTILLGGAENFINYYLGLTQEFTINDIKWANNYIWVVCVNFWNYGVHYLFINLYVLFLIFKIFLELSYLNLYKNIFWNHFINLYLYTWIYTGEDKVETIEEIICLTILWPWCVFLIATHLIAGDNHSFIFGFAEWGLPVLYGLILLIEHFWTFGVYILIYLVGIRGRKSFIVIFLEDLVAMAIMVARVMLQSIRGVIVGMFHFICREALLNMTKWWDAEFFFNDSLSTEKEFSTEIKYFTGILTDVIIAASSLVVVMAIMFLQLIFLIVSVWLFCKCWFMSWNSSQLVVDTYNKFNKLRAAEQENL